MGHKEFCAVFITSIALLSIPVHTTNANQQTNPPHPWTKVAKSEDGFEAWGRKYLHGKSLLPQQITTSGHQLFSRPLTISYQLSGGALQTIELQKTSDEQYKSGYRSFGSYEDDDISVSAVAKLEYDGFQQFDITISPKRKISIDRLEAQIYFNNTQAQTFNKFLEYDFSKQNVIPGSDKSAIGPIPQQLNFHFNPTIWIGNNSIGLEWVQETNIHFSLQHPEATHTITRSSNETHLVTRIIDHPTLLTTPLPYSFALIATPTKPRNTKLKGKVLTSRLPPSRNKNNACCENQIYIGHWKRTPLDLPGLPAPSSNKAEFATYTRHRDMLRQANMPYISYSALYILPAALNIFDDHPDWRAAPARKGSKHWMKKLKKKKSIQPVNYQDPAFRKYIVDAHLNAQQNHDIDGIYFDVATMREVPSMTQAMVEKLNLKPKPSSVYYPLYAHRELLKTYWQKLKAKNPDFIVIHHTASFLKISQPFVDIVVFGEPFHRHFTNSAQQAPGNPEYIPDYFSIERRFIPDHSKDFNGPEKALLPLVSRRNNDYLVKYPDMYRQWSRSAIATTFINDLLLWNTRLEPTTWQIYNSALQKLGGLNDAQHNRIQTGHNDLQVASYTNENKILVMIANSAATDVTIRLDEISLSDNSPLLAITSITDAEQPHLPVVNPQELLIPAKDYLLLTAKIK